LPQPRNDGTTLPVFLHGWFEWASAREQLIRKRRSKLLVRMADADVNQRIVGRPCAENDHEHGAVRYAGPQTSLRWLAGVALLVRLRGMPYPAPGLKSIGWQRLSAACTRSVPYHAAPGGQGRLLAGGGR